MAKNKYKMPTQKSSKVFPIVISLVMIALIGIVALTVSSNKKPEGKKGVVEVSSNVNVVASTVNSETGPAALAPLAEDGQDSEIGKLVPTFTAKDFQDSDVTVAPGKKPYVLAFVAHWCPHCIAEVPLIVGLHDEGKLPKDVDVIAVATGTDSTRGNYPPSKWLSKEEWPWQIVADNQANDVLSAFGGSGFPYLVYIKADGTIQARTSGESEAETVISNMNAISLSKGK